MSVRNVVKVMNFHSLLRVDSAKKQADHLAGLEQQVSSMIDRIVNNRNFILDKRVLSPSASADVLTIYIGSDFGFCANYNSQVNEIATKQKAEDKILIGRKMRQFEERVILRQQKDEVMQDFSKIEAIVEEGILAHRYKAIHVVYNHYENASTIYCKKVQIFPVETKQNKANAYQEDFVVETDINRLLANLIELYVMYELRICMINSHAAENVLRQNTTSESLKKIDEREAYEIKVNRKVKNAREFRKVIEGFQKKRAR